MQYSACPRPAVFTLTFMMVELANWPISLNEAGSPFCPVTPFSPLFPEGPLELMPIAPCKGTKTSHYK